MSEYQYYEFQAIDRPLTEDEQQAVAQLSSRVDPHPWRAVFVYHWSDFPGRAVEVLAKYYDAMLYMANWGSRRLMFRFPAFLIDLEQVETYCHPFFVEEYVSFDAVGEYVVLKIEFHDEEAAGWAEGEGWLDTLIQLREDILQGHYQVLYLAWLKALEMEDVLDSVTEPPVPPGLKKLSPALRGFAEFFEIDADLIEAAAEGSGKPKTTSEDDLRRAIAMLSDEERAAFLLRLAKGEPQLSVAFNRRLDELIGSPQPVAAPRRTVGQLLAAAEEESERVRKQLAAEAKAKRMAEMEALAAREPQTWHDVDDLIQEGNAKSYQKAVALLARLKQLAEYQDQEDAFQERLNQIYDQYARRKALLRRLRDAGLTEG